MEDSSEGRAVKGGADRGPQFFWCRESWGAHQQPTKFLRHRNSLRPRVAAPVLFQEVDIPGGLNARERPLRHRLEFLERPDIHPGTGVRRMRRTG